MSSMSFGSGASVRPQSPLSGAHGHHHHGGKHRQVLDAVSKELGMSTQDVQSSLRSGTSLAQLASQKGVSKDDLLNTIEQALSGGQSGSQTDPTRLKELAQSIADRVPGQSQGPASATASDPDADGDTHGSGSVSFVA